MRNDEAQTGRSGDAFESSSEVARSAREVQPVPVRVTYRRGANAAPGASPPASAGAYAGGKPRHPHRRGEHELVRTSQRRAVRSLRCGNTLPAAIFSDVMARLVKVVRPVGRSTLTRWAITRTWHR